ncbi:GH25 family lysozyme [Arthrobacter sp. Hor0625]|uniref:GH25 family lysozyme n=1 Tax=Arthrobacter sp. Hor0625 TaxID=3457358 RepID=UPI00403ECEBE
MAALQAEIGQDGASMGQGLKTRQSGSPRSGGAAAVAESLETESTWKAPGIQGLDVSSHQPSVAWATQYSMGARFAYIKASEGTTYLSPAFPSQYSGARSVGMMRGAYHFALPSVSTGAVQADYFVNNGGGWSPDGRTMPPLLDIEYNPYTSLGNTCYNMSAASMVKWIRDFSSRVLSRTGRLPMIYTTADWWSRCTGNSGAFGNQPLHLASYSTYVGNIPNGWGTYSVWQYSSTGPFAGDSNAWNGSYASLQKFASTADGAIPKPSIMSTGDVVAADAAGALWDYPATGSGSFGARKQIGHGWTGLRSINVIDWNADGVLDIVAQWTSGRVNVYLGVAAGGFSTGPVLAPSGWAGYQLTIGYWLSSSYFPQILSRDDAGNLNFWRNSSGGAVGAASRIGVGWSNLNLTMVDFDGDGREDLIAQDAAGKLRQYRSNGAGGFISEARPTIGSGWNTMTSVTVTFAFKGYAATGLVARTLDGTLKYFPVPGNSSWGLSSVIGSGWAGFLIAGGETVNAAGSPPTAGGPSIAAATDVVTTDSNGGLYRRSAGTGTLGTATKIGSGFTGIASLHVADWNADGVQDLVTLSTGGVLGVQPGLRAGGFSSKVPLASGLAGATVTIGRWINAGKYPGVVVRRADGMLLLYPNESGTALGPASKIGAGFVRMHILMTDADGDGNQDIAAVDYLGQMSLYRSNGRGAFVFEARTSLGNGWSAMDSISPAPGILAPSSNGILARDRRGTLRYYPLDHGALGTPLILASGWSGVLISGSPLRPSLPAITSMADVLTVDSSGALWNHAAGGTSTVSDPYRIGVGWSSMKSINVVDWNRDDVPDIIAVKATGAVTAYLGLNAGGFRAATVATTGFADKTIVAGNWVNGSRFPGLLGYGPNGDLNYWANPSGGSLSVPVRIGSGWKGLKLAMVDFDSDGKPDLLAVSPTGAMKLYRSTGQNGFISESRKVVGSGWYTFRQFSANAGFAGAGSKGVLAVQVDGQLRYYPIAPGGVWGAPRFAGALGASARVSVSVAGS